MDQTVLDLRDARRRAGLSQADLAARMGTTQSAIARFETTGSDPRLSTVERYARAIGRRLAVEDTVPSLAGTARTLRTALDTGSADEALRLVIQCLDDVGGLDPGLRTAAIRDEPDSVGTRRWDAFLGGAAEYLAHRYGLRVPGWASAPGRFLDGFWFVIEDVLGRPARGLAAIAFATAPAPFANRGVFLDAGTLASV